MATELNLPQGLQEALKRFVEDAQRSFGADLDSVILFGSAAEGRLRATSDVNVIVVLKRFDQAAVDSFRPSLQFAAASVRLSAMFLLASEIPAASHAFAQKFADVIRRHTVLFGSDPFAGLAIPRSALLARVRQVALNLALRLRESYASKGDDLRATRMAVADSIGPLRACAASLLELEGNGVVPGKEALRKLIADAGQPEWTPIPEHLSSIHEGRESSYNPAPLLLQLTSLALHMHARAEKLV